MGLQRPALDTVAWLGAIGWQRKTDIWHTNRGVEQGERGRGPMGKDRVRRDDLGRAVWMWHSVEDHRGAALGTQRHDPYDDR